MDGLEDLQPSPDSLAQGVRWDLDSISPSIEAAKDNWDRCVVWAKDIQARYEGRIASLSATEMRDLLAEYEQFDYQSDITGLYSDLHSSIDSKSGVYKDLAAFVSEGGKEMSNALRFLRLEWLDVMQDQAQQLIDDPILERYRSYLVEQRLYIPHTWDKVAERYWSERSPAVQAWEKLFDDTVSELVVPFDDGSGLKNCTESGIISQFQYNPDRTVRERAFSAFYAELAKVQRFQAKAYDSIVADKIVSDKLRGYPSAMAARNLGNGVTDAVVENMLTTIETFRPFAREWWRIKARAMGLPKLSVFDQYLPLGTTRAVSYGQAQQLVKDAMTAFSPEAYALISHVESEKRLDAESRDGKQGGAYCHPGVGDGKSWILSNFQGQMNDVFTLAHELGHGLHNACAYPQQSRFSAHPPLVLAEIASTMNEMVLFDHLMNVETDPDTRLALVSQRISGAIATVYRQAAMSRFEENAFALRSQKQELTDERLGDIWWNTQGSLFGGMVEMPEPYRMGWSYIGHFPGSPFYVYAYSFADLCTMAIYNKWKTEGPSFWPKYKEFLAAGRSVPTDKLLATVGIDIHNPHCWDGALVEFGRMVHMVKKMIPGDNARAA